MSRIVETTLDIRFSADGEACGVAESDAVGDVARQAELVCLAHYAARTVGILGLERALPLIRSLPDLGAAPSETTSGDAGPFGVRIVPPSTSFPTTASTRIVARFLGSRREPRVFFDAKSRSFSASGSNRAIENLVAPSLYVAFDCLLRRPVETRHARRVVKTAELVGRLAADGLVRSDNEFDVALAAADVAWASDPTAQHEELDGDLECPNCGNRGSTSAGDFDFRLWPSEENAIRRCNVCGSGLWLRPDGSVRRIAPAAWEALETLRRRLLDAEADAATVARKATSVETDDGRSERILGDLKRVFAENRWPFAEVRGMPVLLSDLSGVWGRWKFYAQVATDHDAILFYSVCPLRVPEELRLEAAHFLTRANYGLATGNFELDFTDGEIRFKTVLLVDGEVSPEGVKRAVRANGIAMETYLPGIGAVIAGTGAVPALERRIDS
jgi:hypothetical protein